MRKCSGYFKKRQEVVLQLLQKTPGSYTASTVHQLRVEIKKLNAFFHLLNFCAKKFRRSKTYKPFKIIFVHAGKLRELDVEMAALKKYSGGKMPVTYSKQLKQLRLREKEQFVAAITKKRVAQISNLLQRVLPFLAEINKKKLNRYMQQQEEYLLHFTGKGPLLAAQVHELRKRLKKMEYNRKGLLPDMEDESPLHKDTFTGLLGKWHDIQVMVQHLAKATRAAGLSTTEKKHLQTIKKKWVADGRLLLKQINNVVVSAGKQ